MSFQGGKSLQRTFSLSPVSFSVTHSKVKIVLVQNFQNLLLEWTAISEDAYDNVCIYTKYDR